MIDLSIVVVTFNGKHYLPFLLDSVNRACKDIKHEIIIVDNASTDGVTDLIEQHYPEVILIKNNDNIGFSGANNQGIKISSGRYIALINPDVIVQEDTFKVLLEHMEKDHSIGAITPKIINPDGSFSIDCRHDIPTPLTAFWRAIGLSKLFPKSKIFARYNMTFLDEDKATTVPALSGSFMLLRRSVIEKVGLLDEDFFMYCEDIDFCKRINNHNFFIYYLPSTTVLHFKGESTKKDDYKYIQAFNESMILFYKKHYGNTNIVSKMIIYSGVYFRGILIFLKRKISKFNFAWMDLIPFILLILLSPLDTEEKMLGSLLFGAFYFTVKKMLFFIPAFHFLYSVLVLFITSLLWLFPGMVIWKNWVYGLLITVGVMGISTLLRILLLTKVNLTNRKDLFKKCVFINSADPIHSELRYSFMKNGFIPIPISDIDEAFHQSGFERYIIPITFSVKSVFRKMMESGKKKIYYFFHPELQYMVSDEFSVDLNSSGKSKQSLDAPLGNIRSVGANILFLVTVVLKYVISGAKGLVPGDIFREIFKNPRLVFINNDEIVKLIANNYFIDENIDANKLNEIKIDKRMLLKSWLIS
ncbi:MAG: hypothetical protein Kow00108_09290 [Calditrichia bacterium]